jgi:hypothetical protein
MANKRRSRLSRITEVDPLQIMALQMEQGGALEWMNDPAPEVVESVKARVAKARSVVDSERAQKRREASRAYAKKNVEEGRARALARYYEKRNDPDFRKKVTHRALDYAERKPLAARAHDLVQYRVHTGAMRPASDFPCADCGKPATDYDHRDYNKPLEVEPTCRSCNLLRGPALPYLGEV